MRVFLIGPERVCQQVTTHLHALSFVKILGVVECDLSEESDQRGPSNWESALREAINSLSIMDVDIVFDLTGDPRIKSRLAKIGERRFEIVRGNVTGFLTDVLTQAEEKNALLKKHLAISLMIAESRTVDQVFNVIVSGGMEITDMPVGSLAMFDKENSEFTLLSQIGLPPELNRRTTYPIRHGGITEYILSYKKPIIIPNLNDMSEIDFTPLLHEGICSLIAIPLFSDRELIGILYYDDMKPRTYPEGLVDILSQFATEAVIAIQKHQTISQIRRLSSRDSLTNLYNRNQLAVHLQDMMTYAQNHNEPLTLLMADIDRFKEINETLGYQYGDRALKIIADGIQSALVSEGEDPNLSPRLFRSGGDEFSIILPQATVEKAMQQAVLIRHAVQEASKKVYFPLDISIGAAFYPGPSYSTDQLIVLANRSLLLAKKSVERICIGDRGDIYDSNRMDIIFEPIVKLSEGRIIGYEALSRDASGKIGIQELFKKYAEWGQLSEFKSACFVSQLKKAKEIGLAQVFLNVDSHLLAQCEWILKPPDLDVVLEISESESLQDFEKYLALAAQWKDKGFRFAIDDFGAGFISLPFLSRLNPDYIKIDRSVVLQAVASSRFRTFVKGLVTSLQRDNTSIIIAEGIEQETELNIIRDMDIDLIQGYLLRDLGYAAP